MKRTQVQIPDPLYDNVKALARRRDWSVSEVFRRAVEQYVAESPDEDAGEPWVLPEPHDLGEALMPEDQWRNAVADDEAGDGAGG